MVSFTLLLFFSCSSEKAKSVALSFLPIITWLPSYRVKEYMFGDIVSGISTGVMQLPQGQRYTIMFNQIIYESMYLIGGHVDA